MNRNIDTWIKNRTEHQVKALENASKYFDNKDDFTVNTLEAIYIKQPRGESSKT